MPEHFDWLAAHAFIDSLDLPASPVAGTSEWAALAAEDPRKLAALAIAGTWWVLAQDLEQQARKDAAVDVAEAVNWSAEARRLSDRKQFLERNPWARRRTA